MVVVVDRSRYMTCELEALEFVADRIQFLDKDTHTFSETAPMQVFLANPKTKCVRQCVLCECALCCLLVRGHSLVCAIGVVCLFCKTNAVTVSLVHP